MDINFELYKVFYYVAKTMSFSAASEQLYISQSAVSQSIKLLEEKMGCQLFFRNTKKVRLTREGEILFKHVEQAYNFIKSGERAITEMHTMNQGEIKIGASDTICKYYLLPYLKKFTQIYPNIKIHVTNRTSPRCIDLLRNGSVDFSVINIPERFSISNLNLKKTKTIRDVFIASDNFSDLKDRKVSLKELEKYPILVLEKNSTTRSYFDNLMIKNKVGIKPEVELGSIDLLVEMAKIGLGVAFVPDECIHEELDKGELFVLDIKEAIPQRDLGIITHKSIPLSIAAAKLVEMVAQ